MHKRLKIYLIFLWTLLVYIILSRWDTLDKQALTLMQYGTFTLNATLLFLLSKWKLWVIDIAVLTLLVFRCLITYLLFKFTLDARPGFEHIDIKELQDSVVFTFLPSLIIVSCNWKIDSLLSFPISVLAQLMTLK